MNNFNLELSDAKIKDDFINYLRLRVSPSEVVAIDEVGNKFQKIITIEDDITILAINITFPRLKLTFVPVEILIAIGKFHIEESVYSIDKCSAKLLYNDELEIVDVDFYYSEIHDSGR